MKFLEDTHSIVRGRIHDSMLIHELSIAYYTLLQWQIYKSVT